MTPDNWIAGDAYELFMGRWSRMVAEEFIQWLSPSASWHWLEMGCGTGALTQVILSRTSPAYLIACDLSPQFVSFIRGSINHPSIDFLVADAADLPLAHDVFDVVVSGLVLNFFPTPIEAIRSLRSRLHPGGKLAAYVWDYAEGMEFLRIFWEVAVALDPAASILDERYRFPICRQDALAGLLERAGFYSIESHALEITTPFPDFESYWTPFLGATGPAPSYVSSLSPSQREQLRLRLNERLSPGGGGMFQLTARALAVCGTL